MTKKAAKKAAKKSTTSAVSAERNRQRAGSGGRGMVDPGSSIKETVVRFDVAGMPDHEVRLTLEEYLILSKVARTWEELRTMLFEQFLQERRLAGVCMAARA
jgi:hypothetical protein